MARRLAIVIVLVAFAAPAAARAATLTADYRFAGSYASSVTGAPTLTPLGPDADTFATETVAGAPQTVLTFPAGNGVSLSPTTGVVPDDTYTIAILARLVDVGGYRRYVDFKNGTADTGLYDLDGKLDFYDYGAGSATALTAGAYALVVLTRSAAGQLIGYVNGAQQFAFDDASAVDGVIDPASVLRFFRDNDSGGATTESSAGAVARIRIWNGPLSPAEIAGLGGAGAGAPVPPPVLGKSVDARPTSGRVSVTLPGATAAVPLATAGRLPVGTVVDATAGVAHITSAVAGGKVQSGDFGGGVFKVLQNARERGVTELGLLVPAAAIKSCTATGAATIAAARPLSAKVLALLHATAKGSFRTRGRFSAATVRGTRWDTVERCDGTLTRVKAGVVVVNDLRRHRQVVVRAGHSYLAPAG